MNERKSTYWKIFPYYLAVAAATIVSTSIILHHGGDDSIRWLFVLFLAAGAAGFVIIWRIQRTLRKNIAGAERFAGGDLRFRLEEPKTEMLGDLSMVLNDMAEQLEDRIASIGRERNEQEIVLSSMAEGVIAVDDRNVILRINNTAAFVFGSTPDALTGRSFHEVIRNRELQQLIERTINDKSQQVIEVTYSGDKEHYLHVRCTPLHLNDTALLGALIVLNDITGLKKLERIRRDFVANVSHELKTPLTSIKGFAETLQDGAVDNPEEARKFCAIITRQVDRLQTMIDDLLSLSRIEQEAEEGGLKVSRCSLMEIIEDALQAVQQQAAEKNISIHIDCDPGHNADVNPALLEQVAVNLLDNAIKYSEEGTSVHVAVTPHDREWEISFADQGSGIPASEIDRIFERFYRVDKARSRKVGGTGLGLSIVKHIVSAHSGRIQVKSEMGNGSVFRIFLPIC